MAVKHMPTDGFQLWIYTWCETHDCSLLKIADDLRVSRQTIVNWYNGNTKVDYVHVIALCYITGNMRHVDAVWEMAQAHNEKYSH